MYAMDEDDINTINKEEAEEEFNPAIDPITNEVLESPVY